MDILAKKHSIKSSPVQVFYSFCVAFPSRPQPPFYGNGERPFLALSRCRSRSSLRRGCCSRLSSLERQLLPPSPATGAPAAPPAAEPAVPSAFVSSANSLFVLFWILSERVGKQRLALSLPSVPPLSSDRFTFEFLWTSWANVSARQFAAVHSIDWLHNLFFCHLILRQFLCLSSCQ